MARPCFLSLVTLFYPTTSSTLSLRFASLTSLHESGRLDAPFSCNELVAALSKCHESPPVADCLPYSLFKVSFPWWRHLLLSFPSTWKSSFVFPVIKRVGNPTSLDSYHPTHAFKVFEGCRRHGLQSRSLTSWWVGAALVRLFDFGVTGRLWHLLANFLCGTLSQVRLGGSVSPPWVELRKAEYFSHSFQPARRQSRRSAIPGVSLAVSDSFRHVCQLDADAQSF